MKNIDVHIYCDMKKRIRKLIGDILENKTLTKAEEKDIAIVINKLSAFEDNDVIIINLDTTEVTYARKIEDLLYALYEDYSYETDTLSYNYKYWSEQLCTDEYIQKQTIDAISYYFKKINKERKNK